MQVTKHTSEESTLALKPRGDITKSQNRGMSGPTKRTYVLQNFQRKKNNDDFCIGVVINTQNCQYWHQMLSMKIKNISNKTVPPVIKPQTSAFIDKCSPF